MRIVNATQYATRPLRAMVVRIAKEELEPAVRRRLVVEFLTSTRGVSGDGCIGRASFTRPWARIVLPRNPARITQSWKRVLAHIVAHELAHVRGMVHRTMRGNPRYVWVPGWEDLVMWVDAIEFELKPAARAPKPTIDEKIARIQEIIKTWETKRKRADTYLKKWRRRLIALERKKATERCTEGSDQTEPSMERSGSEQTLEV